MATGSESKGTKKTRGGYRTPKLSEATKRQRALERKANKAINIPGMKTRKNTNTNPDYVPF